MADVGIEQLKEDIQADIKANNNQTITGELLQERLIDTVDTLKGYTDDHVSVSQNTLTIGGEYAGEMGDVYDVTLHNSSATFASLEALLSDANLNTLIPLVVRKGGMSIKFVQTSDNKYVQYRLMTDAWSVDTEDWVIADEGVYIESPEFVYIKTDAEDKILEGIKTDGTKVIGADVEIGGNATILGKVDIQGATYTIQESSEWIKVLTDAQNRIIAGVRKNGSVYINNIEGVTDYINEILNALEQIGIDVKSLTSKVNANYKPDLFYNKYGYSPIVRKNGNKPLIYEINNWFNKAITYPDGTIIYADEDNVIKKVNPDGAVSSLLTISGATDIRMIWMDSQYNVYVSPWLANTSYAENTGIYKLAYGSSNFTHVLSLYNPSSTVPSETSVNNFSVWTMTEDLEGNLYAGIYGQPYCPYIYKSVDGGNTWFFLKDMSTYAQGGIHIHFIEYNKYDNALYCTVGEINKLFKSTDGGNTWVDIDVKLEYMKSCSIHCVEDGIVLGSDYAYWGMMYKVYADGTYRTTAKTLANVIFSIRESDVTGWLYAFGLIDAAVNVRNYYPPEEAIEDEQVLQEWIDSEPSNLAKWREYYNSMINQHPEDAIRPQHSVILISKDRGESWEVLCILSGTSTGMGGYFRNGEIAVARNNYKTIVISEGKHSYTWTGIDCTGDILIKLNENTIVNPIENIQ